jgi:hypothetical protein
MNITFIPGRFVSLITSDFARTMSASKGGAVNWDKIEAAVRAKDEQALIKAISTRDVVTSFGAGTPNRGNIEIRGTQVLYRGEPLFGEDVDRIFSYLQNGFPHESMVNFLEAKTRNVSPTSVASLYHFLENRGMPITDNGTVLGYKGVRGDFYSINTGSEPLIEGVRDERGGIRNTIGSVVAMDRRYVCADNGNPCGPGLHIGSKNYATNWAGNGRVMVVEFSPEHVVSVPSAEHEKLRVYRYRVVGELNGDFLGNTYNNDYVRPAQAVEPDEVIEVETADETEIILAEIESEGKAQAIKLPDFKRFNISDWSKGQAKGFKDGKAHQKRMYYEEDRGRKFRRVSSEFVDGYLAGYRDGRS